MNDSENCRKYYLEKEIVNRYNFRIMENLFLKIKEN